MYGIVIFDSLLTLLSLLSIFWNGYFLRLHFKGRKSLVSSEEYTKYCLVYKSYPRPLMSKSGVMKMLYIMNHLLFSTFIAFSDRCLFESNRFKTSSSIKSMHFIDNLHAPYVFPTLRLKWWTLFVIIVKLVWTLSLYW